MSAQCEITAKKVGAVRLGLFECYLTLWVAVCILAGIALGHWFPGAFQCSVSNPSH